METSICQQLKPISISLSPNTEKDDILLALKLFFQPWKWKKGKTTEELENEFRKYLDVKYAVSFNSGRSALMAILSASKSVEVKLQQTEVLLQAFTCNAAVNPIIWSGFKPIYVDVDEKTFNICVEDLKKKIGPKSRAVIVQHTFGLPAFAPPSQELRWASKASAGKPAEMDEIIKICQEKNLILIEDCAHSLGATYKGRKVGTFGKVAFFSFSRDKVISSVYGGMAVTDDDELAKKIREYQEKIGYPCCCWIFQQLLHPVLMNWLILPTYKILGKYLLVLFQWLQILSKAVHWKEKRGKKPGYFPKRMPNALAILALNQFKKLEKFNEHRKEIAELYRQELLNTRYKIPARIGYAEGVAGGQDTKYREGNIFLRFPVRHEKAHEIIRQAWNKNLLIGDWYTTPIAPYDTKLEKMQYVSGSCPKAEKLTKETLNLPTHINISRNDAKKIIDFLKQLI